MSADLLREAAALMRERAQAALRADVWTRDGLADAFGTYVDAVDETAITDEELDADAEHLGAWHPAVALAVADWLEEEVDRFGDRVDEAMFDIICERALAVARAYLGRDA